KNVWKNEYLDDNPITKEISELRDNLGDDRSSPRYIRTVRSEGYRTVAAVVFPKDYRPQRRRDRSWFGGSPYVGLSAFDATHADVFFGRERMCEKVLKAMSAQLEGGRFVLLHGASGSGKTSLLNAGVIPRLTQPGSREDLRALAVARCDLASAQSSDPLGALAAALATWTLGDRPVFPPQPIENLKDLLIDKPESIERIISEAFRLHPDRKAAELPLAHLLLVIDHGEKLVDATPADDRTHECFSRALTALCGCERTLAIMIVRGDFYQKLQDALPELMELKGSQGHIDVMRPSPREIEEMISAPAECAGLDFERDAETGDDLDYRLREDARGKPDVLPLLQHTLNQLYESRDQENSLLTFFAYNEMGGLEGGIAHRAEEVFADLPPLVQSSLDDVLSLLLVVQPDTGAVSGSHPALDALDENAKALVYAFIDARLFASEQDDERRPRFGVTHEALLRRWPRAADWSEKNQRLLKARAELGIATKRWNESGCQIDHLLNPGIPLIEALEVSRRKNIRLEKTEMDFVAQSDRRRTLNARIRKAAISGLVVLSIAATTMAILAMNSREEAEQRRAFAVRSNALVIGELADRVDSTADSELIEKMALLAIEYCQGIDAENASIDELISCSRAYRKLGEVQLSQSKYEEASSNIEKSVKLSEKSLSKEPTGKKALTEAGEAKSWQGTARRRKGDLEGAISAWKEYLKHTEDLIKYHPVDPESHLQMSYAMTNIGFAESELGHYKAALENFSKSKRIKESPQAKRKNKESDDAYELAVTASFICSIYAKTGLLNDARRCYVESIDILTRLLKSHPKANDWKRQLASLLQLQAAVELDLGKPEQAETTIEKAIYHYCRLTLEDVENDDWMYNFAHAHSLAGDISIAKSDIYLAKEHFQLTENFLSFKKNIPPSWKRLVAVARFKSSRYAQQIQREDEMNKAIALLQEAHQLQETMPTRLSLAEAIVSKAEYFKQSGNEKKAISAATEASSLLKIEENREPEKGLAALSARIQIIFGDHDTACALVASQTLKEYKNHYFLTPTAKEINCILK
nr:winged helix-turn-helix domain-containing protein [Xanthomonadaceae bacterium]